MNKIYISSEDIDVDICEKCGGIFLDRGEMFKINNELKNLQEIGKYLDKYASESGFVSVDDREMRVCPVCGVVMKKDYVADGSVLIDSCEKCGGIFLDRGELEKIRETFENS